MEGSNDRPARAPAERSLTADWADALAAAYRLPGRTLPMTDLPLPSELDRVTDWADVVATLYRDPALAAAANTAANATTAADVLDELADHDLEHIVYAVISNPAAPATTLTRLTAHPDRGVRAFLARRDQLPEPVIAALAADPDHVVRFRIAQRNDLTDDHRTLLALTAGTISPEKTS
jgi:hypothetical protein